MAYTLTQSEFVSLRRKLRLAKTSKDNARILKVAEAGLARFDEVGYPDSWHEWNIAAEDARYAIAMERGRW